MSPRPIEVRVTGDSHSAVLSLDRAEDGIRSLDRTAQKSSSGLGRLKSSLLGLGAGLIAGAGLREGIGLLKESIGLASTLGDTVSAAQAVFGKKSDILAWSQSTNAALSLTQEQILRTATGFDTLLTNKGFGKGVAAQMSKDLTELAADLSSFFGGSASDAAQALNAAIKGEMDPIERFGVTLDDATLKARAYAMGLYSGKGALTANAKAQAAYAEIMRQTSKAQGDLIRTQGSAANQIRQFETNVASLKTTLGTAFIPLIEEYLPGVNDWLKSINNEETAEKLGEKFLGFAKTIENDIVPKLKEFGGKVKDAFKGTDTDALKDAIGNIGGAIENIVAGAGRIAEAFSGLSPETQKNIATIVAAGTALGVLSKHNPVIKIGVDLVAGAIGTISTAVINRIFRGVQPVLVTNTPLAVVGTGDSIPGGGAPDRPKSRIAKLIAAGETAFSAWIGLEIAKQLAIASIEQTPEELRNRPLSEVKNDIKALDEQISGIKQDQVDLAELQRQKDKNTRDLIELNGKTDQEMDAETRRENRRALAEESRRLDAEIATAEAKNRVAHLGLSAETDMEREQRRQADAALKSSTEASIIALSRRMDVNEATARAFFTKAQRLSAQGVSAGPSAAGRSAPVVYQTNTFNVTGAGDPDRVGRSIARQVRLAGDRAQASVSAA